ncbi:YkvA family protein [Paenibacillus sp. PL2-23]|uniref:YkvA family protein n=1 Tax=Paenibacillus sp. PL2-23 TaxID=2100729 RepID=UPI0030F95CED
MLKTLECPACGQLNNVDTQKLSQEICGTCKAKFTDEETFVTYKSNEQLASALEMDGEFPQEDKVDVNEWTSKIGGSDKQEQYVKEGFLKKLKKHASKIPFAKDALAMYFCAIDSKTPVSAKMTAFGALAYIVLPFDLMPDIVLGLGYTDDAAAFWTAFKVISIHITDEHRQQAEDWFAK